MILEAEIKVKSPHGYNVTYKIYEIVHSCECEKEFIDKCKKALEDGFRVSGINKRNLSRVND